MIPIEDLITPVTEDQFFEQFLSNLETVGLKARSWRRGGVYCTIIRVLAAFCAAFSDLQCRFIRSGFLEFAEGNWLTWVAYYVYGVERPESTFATGEVTLTNGGGGDYTWAPRQLRVFNSTLDKAYTNQDEIHLGPLSVGTFPFIAVESGAASSSTTGAIDDIETTYADEITVTNEAPVIGSDPMPDDELRQLAKDKRDARSVFGVRGAYRYAIRSAKRAGGSTVDVNRMSISPSSSTGTVTMYVASPSGVPTDDDVQLCRDNVELLARPDTVSTSLDACTPVTITRNLTIWAEKQEGLSAADLRALALQKLVLLNRNYPVGGIKKAGPTSYFWADKLEGAVQSAHPSIFDVEGIGDNEAMTTGQVAIFAVTIDAVHIVDTEVH